MTQKSNGVPTNQAEFTNTPITQQITNTPDTKEKESPSVPSDGGFERASNEEMK